VDVRPPRVEVKPGAITATMPVEATAFKQNEPLNQNQTAGDRGINIGKVEIDGLSLALVLLLAGICLLLYGRHRKAMTTVDMFVKAVEETVEEGEGSRLPEKLRLMALSRGVESFLRSRIRKIRKDSKADKSDKRKECK